MMSYLLPQLFMNDNENDLTPNEDKERKGEGTEDETPEEFGKRFVAGTNTAIGMTNEIIQGKNAIHALLLSTRGNETQQHTVTRKFLLGLELLVHHGNARKDEESEKSMTANGLRYSKQPRPQAEYNSDGSLSEYYALQEPEKILEAARTVVTEMPEALRAQTINALTAIIQDQSIDLQSSLTIGQENSPAK